MNNLNCHPECIEEAQPLHISSHDVAENAKLNHEIAEELRKYKTNRQLSCQCSTLASRSNKDSLATWIHRSSRSMTRMYVLLSIITLLPALAQAETCTATPDCKSLGYTETSCPDGGGVRCPWNTSLLYCCKKCEDKPQTGLKNGLYYCNGVVNGVQVGSERLVVALHELGSMTWESANSQSRQYTFCGNTKGALPTKEQLLKVYSNIDTVQSKLSSNGGTRFGSNEYWSSSSYYVGSGVTHYWLVYPVSNYAYRDTPDNSATVRPVLAF